MNKLASALCAALLSISAEIPAPVNDALILGDTLPPRLSDFHLLSGAQGRVPSPQLNAYSLNTPLFSDYSEKFRFAYIPRGKKAQYRADAVLDFPVGSVLVKSFGYPADMRAPTKDIRILETRLLIRRASGWIALPYVWTADGSDALLKRSGTRIDVSWMHSDGALRRISYSVPNVNQCKGCHSLDGAMTLIGPKARNLDTNFLKVAASGVPASIKPVPAWNDPAAGSVAERARGYIDVNCAHCHNPRGPASNSGLFLEWEQTNPVSYGVGKRPVAAGQGSGRFDFDIAAGHPEQSILIYRLASTEPGIAMPELGRATAHKEGLALLSQWISAMPAKERK